MKKNKSVFYAIIINEKIPVFGDLDYLSQFFLLQSAFLSHVLFVFEQFLHLLPLFSGFDIFIPFFCFFVKRLVRTYTYYIYVVVLTICVFSHRKKRTFVCPFFPGVIDLQPGLWNDRILKSRLCCIRLRTVFLQCCQLMASVVDRILKNVCFC